MGQKGGGRRDGEEVELYQCPSHNGLNLQSVPNFPTSSVVIQFLYRLIVIIGALHLSHRLCYGWRAETLLQTTYPCFIGVGLLGVESAIVLDVLKSLIHESSVASVVAPIATAIDEILLAQRNETTILAEHLTLE